MAAYLTVDVTSWVVADFEPMGSTAGKVWLQTPSDAPVEEGRWLFKARTMQRGRSGQFPKGDDWAEKV